MVNTDVTELLRQRSTVISERRQALLKWVNATSTEQKRLFYEFIQPLGQELLMLNRKLGL